MRVWPTCAAGMALKRNIKAKFVNAEYRIDQQSNDIHARTITLVATRFIPAGFEIIAKPIW